MVYYILLLVFCPFTMLPATADEPIDLSDPVQTRKDRIVVLSVERMKNFDWRAKDSVREAVERHIRRATGKPEFLDLVKKFNPNGMESEILALATANPDNSTGVEAIEYLLSSEAGTSLIEERLEQDTTAASIAGLLGLLGNESSNSLLAPIISNSERTYEVRATAVRRMVTNSLGAGTILDLASVDKLPGDLKLLASGLLARSPDETITKRAAEILPMPTRADQQPLPAIDQLAAMRGDVIRGAELFRTKGTCANCHIVNGEGKQVGPDLSEIGDKLSREAMVISIIDPSAGISHNYENYVCLLVSGQIVTGVMVSETEVELTLRTAEAIDRTLSMDDVEVLKKSEKSIMPEELHHQFDTQGLVDLIEYLATLKKQVTK